MPDDTPDPFPHPIDGLPMRRVHADRATTRPPRCQWPTDRVVPNPERWHEGAHCGAVVDRWYTSPAHDRGPTLDVCDLHAVMARIQGWFVIDADGEELTPGHAADIMFAAHWLPTQEEMERLLRPLPVDGSTFNEGYAAVKSWREAFRPHRFDPSPLDGDRCQRCGSEGNEPWHTNPLAEGVARGMGYDTPTPRHTGVWRPGDQPRGCVAPCIAYGVLGAAVGLALAGELYDAWVARRHARRLLRELNRRGRL